MRTYREQVGKLHYRLQKQRWFADMVECYLQKQRTVPQHIRGVKVTGSRYQGKSDYGTEIERTVENARHDAAKDYRVTLTDPPAMNPVEERVLELLEDHHGVPAGYGPGLRGHRTSREQHCPSRVLVCRH